MYNNQMEMAFMQEGGLQDEGGTVDPVSGNAVPSGSTKKEVRDDIPAMLSEGEFVFPADVVRFIGLNKLMEMRQQAKMGLQMMEKMGQMGNSDEAEIPDDLPFGVTDIVVVETDDKKEDDKKDMAQGGVIYAQEGTDIPSNKRSPNKLYPVEYTDKDGNIKIINEDYLGAPQGSASDIFAVTMGALKRKTPYDPPTSTDSLEDSSIPKSSLESTESTGRTGFYYKGFTGERELTPEQIEFLKKTKPKVFSDERIKAQGLQKILNSQNRLGFILEPEEAERRKKEKRKETREKNRRDLLDARVQQDIEKLGITKEQYYNSDKDGNPVEGGLTFKDRLDLAKKDIQERVEKLPIELSQKKQLVKQSLDNFKNNKFFNPAVVTDPTPLISSPNLLPEVSPIGVAKPIYTSPEVKDRVDPTIKNYMKPVDVPSSTPLPSVSVLPPPIVQDAQPLKVDPTIEVSPTPYIPQTSSDKAQTTSKPVDAATFVTETVLNYLKTLFPNDKKSQNEVLKEAFNMGTGVAKPSPRVNLKYKKGGLMKKNYP